MIFTIAKHVLKWANATKLTVIVKKLSIVIKKYLQSNRIMWKPMLILQISTTFYWPKNAITPSLNKEEIEEYEKNQLFHWLKAASNDSQYQQRCDYYFHALCKEAGFFPATKNIKTDVDTLYALAKQVAQSKEEISNLKKQLSFMEEHSRLLEAKVNSLTAENTNLKEQVDNFKLSHSLSLNTSSSFFFNQSDPNNCPGNVYKAVKTIEKNALKNIKEELQEIKQEQFVNQCLRSMC